MALDDNAKSIGSKITLDKASVSAGKAKVNTRGPHWDPMQYYFVMRSALLGGTPTMRDKPEYLPRFPDEDTDGYTYRLNNSWLHGFYERIAEIFTGMIFNDPVTWDTKIPDTIMNDVDLEGSSAHDFLQDACNTAMTGGFCVCLCDMPPLATNPDGTIRRVSKAEELDQNIRPKWIKIEPENIIAGQVERIKNIDVITHLRWFEVEQKPNGDWGFITDLIIRVIRKDNKGNMIAEKYSRTSTDAEYKLESSSPYGQPFVTAFILYSAKPTALFTVRPLLAKIGEKNIEYWQTSSDQRNILTVSRFSILHKHKIKGEMEAVGPFLVVTSEEDDAKIEWVSNNNPGIEHGEKDKDRIIQEVESLAVELIVRPKETATKTKTNNLHNMSSLQLLAKHTEIAGNMMMYYTALWSGISEQDAGKLKVNKDFGIVIDDVSRLNDLNTMYSENAIDQRQFLNEKKSIGILSADFNIDTAIDDSPKNPMPNPRRTGSNPNLTEV